MPLVARRSIAHAYAVISMLARDDEIAWSDADFFSWRRLDFSKCNHVDLSETRKQINGES